MYFYSNINKAPILPLYSLYNFLILILLYIKGIYDS